MRADIISLNIELKKFLNKKTMCEMWPPEMKWGVYFFFNKLRKTNLDVQIIKPLRRTMH
jgi:hypothetical protein